MASIDSRYPGKFRARISIPDLPRLTKTFSSRKEAEDWASFQEDLILKIQTAVEKKWSLAELAKRAPTPTTSADFKIPCLADLPYETPTLHEALSRYLLEVNIRMNVATGSQSKVATHSHFKIVSGNLGCIECPLSTQSRHSRQSSEFSSSIYEL